MADNMLEKIEKYVLKVIEDAHKAEQRENHARAQVCILDNTALIALQTGFDRVDRRVVYRLFRNFTKNFGMEISIANRYGEVHFGNTIDVPRSKYRLSNDSGIDPNHCVAVCKMLGKFHAINSYRSGPYVNPEFDASQEAEA